MTLEDSTPPFRDAGDAFDELGRLMLNEQSMESVLQKVADLAKVVVPGASEVSVSLVTNERASTAAFTGQLAMDLDERQYENGDGPCLQAAVTGETTPVDDVASETRWSEYTKSAVERGLGSSLSTPIPLQQQASAALNIYSLQAHAFDEHSRQLAATFASYAAVALANMHLYDSTRRLATNLETAMASRAVIDQAKGILMTQRRCDAEQAFGLLVAASQRTNRKLREVAQDLVDSASRPPEAGSAASS